MSERRLGRKELARKKKPIRVRVAQSGATVGLILPTERMDELLSALPEGELRDLLVVGRETAEERTRVMLREKRLETSLSPESLEMLGWNVIGEESQIAFAASRSGDFRMATVGVDSGWEYGPVGAFDRDPEGTRIMRGAIQVGVFSQSQSAFRLLDPSFDAEAAISEIEALTRHWQQAVKGIGKPKHDVYDLRRAKAMLDLPEGARALACRFQHANSALQFSRMDDEILHGSDRTAHVSTYPCEAVLLPERTFDEGCGRALISGLKWCVGRRLRDDRYALRDDRDLLDGPYDVVMGSAWAVFTNAPNTRHGSGDGFIQVAGPSDAIVNSREGAVQEADDMAMRFGVGVPAGEEPRVAA